MGPPRTAVASSNDIALTSPTTPGIIGKSGGAVDPDLGKGVVNYFDLLGNRLGQGKRRNPRNVIVK